MVGWNNNGNVSDVLLRATRSSRQIKRVKSCHLVNFSCSFTHGDNERNVFKLERPFFKILSEEVNRTDDVIKTPRRRRFPLVTDDPDRHHGLCLTSKSSSKFKLEKINSANHQKEVNRTNDVIKPPERRVFHWSLSSKTSSKPTISANQFSHSPPECVNQQLGFHQLNNNRTTTTKQQQQQQNRNGNKYYYSWNIGLECNAVAFDVSMGC